MTRGSHIDRPTRYAGVRFRSLLEARWAALFDAVGWTWDYEPDDLRGAAADFIVDVPGYGPTHVEIRPARDLDQLAKLGRRAATSGNAAGVMVFGLGPFGDGRTLGARFDGASWTRVRTKTDLRDMWRDAYNPAAWSAAGPAATTARRPGFAAKVPWFARARASRLARGDDEVTAGAWAALVDLVGATDSGYCDWMAGLLLCADEVEIDEAAATASARYRDHSIARTVLTPTMQQRMMAAAGKSGFKLMISILPAEAFDNRGLWT